MKTIETTTHVGPDRILSVPLPPEIPPGMHRVVVVIEELPLTEPKREALQLSAYPVGLVSNEFTFRRDDLYDDACS